MEGGGVSDTMGSGDESIELQEEMHPVLCSGDLGPVGCLKEQQSLTEDEILYLLRNHFVAGKGYMSIPLPSIWY